MVGICGDSSIFLVEQNLISYDPFELARVIGLKRYLADQAGFIKQARSRS